MSDFDKEAERERLREKYESEDDESESTRRMSELLLKGATMTDHHCEECGDPIFRYDGQAFCPTCQGVGEGEGAAAAEGRDAAGVNAAETAADGSPAAAGGAGADGVEVETPADATGADAGDRADSTRNTAARGPAPGPDATGVASTDATEVAPTAATGATEGGGDRGTARASLERTLVRFAGEAEAADDPRHARDLLAAAREAAEALAALDRR